MADSALPIALQFISEREGFQSRPYRDSGGKFTIGYGFTVLAGGHAVTATTPPITQQDASAQLSVLVSAVMANVRAMIYVPVNDNVVAALTSFAYNEGTGALRNSTLLSSLNKGEPLDKVAQQFAAWVYVGQQRNQGLVNRRNMEKALFLQTDGESEADILDQEYNPQS